MGAPDIVGGFTGIGLATSRAMLALGTLRFLPDTLTKYFTLGLEASVKPAFIAIVAFALLQLLVSGRRLACAMFPRARRFDSVPKAARPSGPSDPLG